MSIFRVPAAVTTTDEPKHWHIASRGTHPAGLACGRPITGNRYSYTSDVVTCADCLAVVVRRFCNAVSPEPGPMPARCGRDPHEGGLHDWEVDDVPGVDPRRTHVQRLAAESFAASAERDMLVRRAAEEGQHADLAEGAWSDDGGTPSGRLPVRTPGAARGEREVIERWPA